MRAVFVCFVSILFFSFTETPLHKKPASDEMKARMFTTSAESRNFPMKVTYPRFKVEDDKVWGELIPYGHLWSPSSKDCATIHFKSKVVIGETTLLPGTYALYIIPGVDSWEIILNKDIHNWGIDSYNRTKDAVRFQVPTRKPKKRVDTFSMNIEVRNKNKNRIYIAWDDTFVFFNVSKAKV